MMPYSSLTKIPKKNMLKKRPRTPWTYSSSIWAYYGYEYEGEPESVYNNALEEILILANRGARHAQRVARQAGVPVESSPYVIFFSTNANITPDVEIISKKIKDVAQNKK